jgi:hypothetical protein
MGILSGTRSFPRVADMLESSAAQSAEAKRKGKEEKRRSTEEKKYRREEKKRRDETESKKDGAH